MNKLLLTVLLLCSSSLWGESDIAPMVEEIKDFSLDSAAAVKVQNYHFKLDYADAVFKDGEFYFYAFVDGEPTAVFFKGRGELNYFPPDAGEMQQVDRFYGDDTLAVRFDQAYLVFSSAGYWFDSLAENLEKEKPRYRIRAFTRRLRKMPDDIFKYDLALSTVQARLDNQEKFLWADFVRRRYHHTIYFFNPYDMEQVSIYKYSPEFVRPQWVSSYYSGEEEHPHKLNRQTKLFHYDFDINLSTYGKSEIACDIALEVRTDSIKTIELTFPKNYNIDRLHGDVADSESYFKEKGHSGLTVELSRFFYRGDTVHIGMEYRTNLFYHYMRLGVVQEHLTHWYPYQGYRTLATYSIKYTIDKDYSFISVGTLVQDTVVGNKRTYYYRTERPVAYISFNYGVFDKFTIEGFDPPINIYTLPEIHSSPIFGNPNLQKTAEDIAGSFRFYNDHFAPYRFDRLEVAAMSVGFGQGSPGVVHLPSVTFTRSVPGYDDKLRAHEVAHQWWGHIVNPATYRDVWLSEGLAEYSAAMYIEQAREDDHVFRDILKEWRKDIIQHGKRRGLRSVGYRAGSLYLGERLRSELSPADYLVLVYSKAAYMLHMLRYELETVDGKEGAFLDLLAEFSKANYNRLTFTDDFIEVARKYLGGRTDSFFRQWLYDWRLPKIEKKKKIQPTGTVSLTLKMKDVASDVELYYPVKFIFKHGGSETKLYKLVQGTNRFEYSPPISKLVKKIEYNPYLDILEK